MAKIIAQTYSARRGAYGKPSLQCDTGTARLVLFMDDAASGQRFKLEFSQDEVVRLATIVLGPVLADLADQARAKLAKVVK